MKAVPATAATADVSPTPHETTLAVKPTDGSVSSAYGQRKLPAQRLRMHKGIDLQAQHGTPVVASADGIVCFVGNRKGYGKMVILEHSDGVKTLYAHLDTTTVHVGTPLHAGTQLGTVGRTGRTTGANLHFEVLIAGKAVNPAQHVNWM